MAANGGIAILIALFFLHVYGRHECERPCLENAERIDCYYHFTLAFAFQKCVNVKNEECQRRMVLSINGLSPGPMIRVCRGDIVTVDVKNALPVGMEAAIHWHGLNQRQSPFMDGVPMITQCPIHSGTSFRYRMKLDQSGTFYYHAHSVQQQLDGLYGALIVHEDETINEKIMLFAAQLNEPTSLLNGVVTDLSSPEFKSFTYDLGDGDRVQRIRLINAAAIDCPLSVISTDKLRIEAVDGNKVTPVEMASLLLYPGERVDITSGFDFDISGTNLCDGQRIAGNFTTEEPAQKFDLIDYYNQLDSAIDSRIGEESYRVYLPFHTVTYSYRDNPVDFRYKLGEIAPYIPAYINGNTDTVSVQQFRNVAFLYPSSPVLSQESDVDKDMVCESGNKAATCHRSHFCECLNILQLPYNETVDLVIVDEGDSSARREHTFHIHGHKVQIIKIASFERAITVNEIKQMLDSENVKLKLSSPVEKDTVVVPKMGYAMLRMKTDNPGYWLLESIPSKIESGIGLEVVLFVPEEGGRQPTPKGFPKCNSLKPQDLVIIEE